MRHATAHFLILLALLTGCGQQEPVPPSDEIRLRSAVAEFLDRSVSERGLFIRLDELYRSMGHDRFVAEVEGIAEDYAVKDPSAGFGAFIILTRYERGDILAPKYLAFGAKYLLPTTAAESRGMPTQSVQRTGASRSHQETKQTSSAAGSRR